MSSRSSGAPLRQKGSRAVWAFAASLGTIWAIAVAAGVLLAVR